MKYEPIPKYESIPKVEIVEAIKWDGSADAVSAMMQLGIRRIGMIFNELEPPYLEIQVFGYGPPTIVRAHLGDYVVKGETIKAQKPDYFEANYHRIE